MTTNNKNIWVIVLVIILLISGIFYFNKKSTPTAIGTIDTPADITGSSTVTDGTSGTKGKPTTGVTKPTTVLTTGNIKGFYSYANLPYSFSLQYPSYAKALTSFTTFHEIGSNWRLYPGQANQGKSVVAFSIYNVDQGIYSGNKSTYPLYFTAEVRVGVSTNTKNCYAVDPSYPNEKVANAIINGVTFKKFSTSDAAMMKYSQAESYRTIHNNFCYVIEQIKSGTIYRDEKMTMGTTDAQLETYYNLGEKVIKTFKFTK
jgi:hypothetical protein